MQEKYIPRNTIEKISVVDLLPVVMEKKKRGLRLSQACAAFSDGKYELSYSFADDENYDYETLRITTDTKARIPSITEIMPQAVFYENEMKEMFGVNIEMISTDLDNRLYRIEREHPLMPKQKEKEA